MDLNQEAEKIRKILNKRREDISLTFIEEDHLYFMRDNNGMIRSNYPSVSKVIKKFYEEYQRKSLFENPKVFLYQFETRCIVFDR